MKTTPTYSIIVPVYNGSAFLPKLVERINSSFASWQHNLMEIILVDDYSQDDSWTEIKKLKSQHPSLVHGIRLSRNFGQHNATCAGMLKASGDLIITIDDDLEVLPEDALKLIQEYEQKELDVVYGKFKKANRSLVKKFFKFFYEIISKIVGGNNKVNGSSFRLMNRSLAKKIAENATNFVFIDEAVFWHTNKIGFVTVEHQKSLRKKSHYGILDLFRLGGDVVMYSSLLPIKVVKALGFFISLFMFILGTFFIIKQLFFGVSIKGFTALIVTISFSTGIILLVLGIIGEYLGKIFRNTNNSPVYSIDEEI
ncbi:glycosyltransferase family 2 protein [Parvicella tangerina]|uniref:Glycosyltransferase n=1 Tax=Parvicella tangerina TaxID=2829795 RepID=A0A916NG45_9FLAO|nr:glycosyltransferase [Parvicella tangerina]CAG5079140.1 putative glycosyltransferase [Parvicella tangerina]